MADFNGTVQEFHHFVGPRIRNLINNFTRQHRRDARGICEFCESRAVLHSAHVHGRDRRTIIESVLAPYQDSSGAVKCDIKQVEGEILSAHQPIHETFKFICQPCHIQYDSTSKGTVFLGDGERTEVLNDDFVKLARIRRWATRPNQANHRVILAFLELETKGNVTRSAFKRYCVDKYGVKNFDQHFASMKTDSGNSHGKIFYEEGDVVKLWDTVRIEIEEHFPQT